MKRLLALDVGTVRVGVALSDPLGITAQPFDTLQRRDRSFFSDLQKIIADHEVAEIIVGYPVRLDGSKGPATVAIEQFVEELKKWTPLPVVFWDERMTTAQAQRMMIDGDARRSTRKQHIDKIAAAIILQSYMDSRIAETP